MASLSKRASPMIGKFSELLVSGNRHGFLEPNTSPRSPLEVKIQSPRGSKRFDLTGVGLGIVAAMETSRDVRARCVVSNPIAIDRLSSAESSEFDEDDDEEDYTFVTRRGPNNETFTTVFYDGGSTRRRGRSTGASIFDVASSSSSFEEAKASTSDFLSSCDLCRKKLDGKDIFMYRGEKAFCSSECRSSQMMMDERKEQCRVEASKSVVDASNSPYSRGQIFSTGIMAI